MNPTLLMKYVASVANAFNESIRPSVVRNTED